MRLEPFGYQLRAIESLRDGFRKGHNRGLLCMLMGAGKSVAAMELMRLTSEKGNRCLFLCDRRMLADQACDVANEQGLDAGILMAGRGSNMDAACQFASKQSLLSWIKKGVIELPDFKLIVTDECFIGETEILTSMGPRRIDMVRPGDRVYCASGVGTVESVSCRTANDLYQVELSDGSDLVCTGEHPIFTDSGWIQARKLEQGSLVYGPEAVRRLWENYATVASRQIGSGRGKLEKTSVLLSILLKEVQEPNEQSSISPKNEGATSGNKAQANKERRQRAVASFGAACDFARARGWMGIGDSCSNRSLSGRKRVSIVLQAGHRKPVDEDRDRVGRRKPLHSGKKGTGREETSLAGDVRVVRVSRVERKGNVPVFNLQVSGHPSYFANGKLVHNCHRAVSETWMALHKRWPRAFHVGLTATPCLGNGDGMGAYYDFIVQPIKPSELRDLGRIVKVRAFAPHVPDLKGVKKGADGDYQAKDLSKRLCRENLIGDVCGWWKRLGQDRPSVYFGCDVAHAMAIRDEFRASGVSAELICDETPDDERADIKRRSKNGEIKIVVNCDVLAEGVDWPWVSLIGLVRPTKRLRRYLQCTGRGLRSAPDKIDCLLLDHAGCVPYHGMPDIDREWPLDPRDNVDKKNQQKPPGDGMIRCSQCSAMFTGSRTCPECGHTHVVVKQPKEYAKKNGSLVEVNGDDMPVEAKVLLQQRFWGMCIGVAIKRGRRAGMAAGMFSDKFGIPPWQAGVKPLPVHSGDWQKPACDVFPGFSNRRSKGDSYEG